MEMKSGFNWLGFLGALAMLAVGVLLLVNPASSALVLIYFLAGILIVIGVALLAMYFSGSEMSKLLFGGLVSGLTLVTVGVLLLIKPTILVVALPVFVGIVLVVSGFYNLEAGLTLRRAGLRRWGLPLAFALLSIAAGILMIVNPFGTTEMLMIFGGAALCLEGVLQALSAFMFKTE